MCLILVEIANLTERIYKAQQTSILVGCLSVCIYRCLAIPNENTRTTAHFPFN